MAHLRHILATSLLVSCVGCFTIDRAPLPEKSSDQIVVTNYGWYLFNAIPLACGNASPDRLTPWVFFRNDVTLDKIQRRFIGAADDSPDRLSDLAYKTHNEVMFEIPGLSIPLPIPYILTYREIQLSGVLK